MWHVLWIREIAGKPEGKRPLESPMRRWKDNINLAQDRDTWRLL